MRILNAKLSAAVLAGLMLGGGTLTFVRATPGPKPSPVIEGKELPATAGVERARTLRLRQSILAVIVYVNRNDNHFPNDLGATLPYADEKLKQQIYIAPDDEKKLDKPSEPTAGWVNEHTSFVYLGSSALTWKTLNKVDANNGNTAIMHEKFEGMEGKKVAVAFIDAHVEMLSLDDAKKAVNDATAKFSKV